jgi:hypothetical protein
VARFADLRWLNIMATSTEQKKMPEEANDIPDDVKNLLGPNEKVEVYIKEKIYHPQISIDSMIVTNERVILRHPHAAGMKKDYTDHSYSDIAGVGMNKGLLRSKIKLTIKGKGESMDLDKLPTPDAEHAYGIIRENVGRFQAPFSTGNATAPIVPNAPVEEPDAQPPAKAMKK